MQAILTIGVSASGKSTWAKDYVENKKLDNEEWLVINQDEIRLFLIHELKGDNIDEIKELKQWNYDPEGACEKLVKEKWNGLVTEAIAKNYNGLIISDTNLDGGGKKIDKLINMGVETISTQLFPITFEEALVRDRNRNFVVGEAVLKMQFEKLSKFLSLQDNIGSKKIKM